MSVDDLITQLVVQKDMGLIKGSDGVFDAGLFSIDILRGEEGRVLLTGEEYENAQHSYEKQKRIY